MISSIIQIVIIVILIVLSAFFSSSETALTGVSSVRLRAMCDEGVKNALVLEKVLSQKDKMLSVILICNNIVNLSASALTTVVMQNLFGNAYVAIGTGILTLLVLIFGEVAPKTMATYRAEKLALKFCGPIRVLMIVFTPIAAVVNFLASGVMRIFGVKKSDKAPITETELRTMVTVSQEEGVIESEEEELINNIIDFSDTIAREIMVPRINVTSIRIDSTYQEITEVFRVNHFTRLPVMDEANEKVVGIVNVKDLVFYDPEKIDDFRVEDVMREAEFTFENKHLWDLFMEMKKASAAMMIVLDEYGDMAGIVTMEDLIEEIVGDIRDEFDESEIIEIVKLSDDHYQVQGHVSLYDVNDRIGTELASDDYDSIGGVIIEQLERFPEEGESVQVGDVTLTAVKMDKTRIELVDIKLGKEAEERKQSALNID